MALLERNVSTLSQILNAVEELSETWDPSPYKREELWFRGVSSKRHKLLPGIYRQPANGAKPFDEINLFERFKALATPYTSTHIDSQWEWYFLAQHYRLPTRLLDWTESLMAAIYFAIGNDIESMGPAATEEAANLRPPTHDFGDDSPVVWLIDAGSLNCFTLGPNDDAIICPGGTFSSQYLPDNICNTTDKNRYPFAILPTRANTRIIAQQGMFTIHGHESIPIEELIGLSRGCDLRIGRLTIDKNMIPQIWIQLQRAGMNRLCLFPDLDSVSFHVKWISTAHI